MKIKIEIKKWLLSGFYDSTKHKISHHLNEIGKALDGLLASHDNMQLFG